MEREIEGWKTFMKSQSIVTIGPRLNIWPGRKVGILKEKEQQ